MLMLLSVHVTSVLFQYGSIVSPWLWASIGVTHSYSSRPCLCARSCYTGLAPRINAMSKELQCKNQSSES